jgi:cyclophilin family peptidyl-prolyl cis-trans isomerase
MAREAAATDSATSSFSILVGDAPHLDHQYTIFGYVVPDAETVQTMDRISRGWTTVHPYIMSVKELDLHNAGKLSQSRL